MGLKQRDVVRVKVDKEGRPAVIMWVEEDGAMLVALTGTSLRKSEPRVTFDTSRPEYSYLPPKITGTLYFYPPKPGFDTVIRVSEGQVHPTGLRLRPEHFFALQGLLASAAVVKPSEQYLAASDVAPPES